MIVLLALLAQTTIDVAIDQHYLNKKLTIGDPFTITLTLSYPQQDMMSEPFADSLGAFVITEQKNTLRQTGGMVTSTYLMKLVAFDTGELQIPAFTVMHTHADSVDTLTSTPLSISIASVLPEDMTDINDLKPAVEYPNFLPLIIAGILVASGILTYGAIWLIKRYRKLKAIATPPVPPWIEALAALENIPVSEWIEKGMVKRYYYTLSEILKRYLERRFTFNALEQTTTEIVYQMKTQKVPLRDDFSIFFTRADLVKYAKLIPPAEELQGAAARVRSLVEQTTPTTEEKAQS